MKCDIDLKNCNDCYPGLTDALMARRIPTYAARKEAEQAAKNMGWRAGQVLRIERRFEWLWCVGQKISSGEGRELYRFPTGYVRGLDGVERMEVFEVRADRAEIDVRRARAEERELAGELSRLAGLRDERIKGWSNDGVDWRACDDELRTMLALLAGTGRSGREDAARKMVEERGRIHIRQLVRGRKARVTAGRR